MTVDQLWEQYFFHLRSRRRSKTTLTYYAATQRKLGRYLGERELHNDPASGPEVVALTLRTTCGGWPQVVRRVWRVGDPSIKVAESIPRPDQAYVVLHRPDAALGFVSPCLPTTH